MIAALLNHLWQSTLFAIAAGLLTFVFRNNGAHVRYWLWLSASLKFLLPFSLLIVAGNHIKQAPAVQRIAAASQSLPIAEVSRPFPDVLPPAASPRATHWIPVALACLWECGFLSVVWMRFRGWQRIRAIVRASTPMDIPSSVETRSAPAESAGLLEPGVVGILRSIFLVPDGIRERLTPAQWQTVLDHELCHVRRRDNLTSTLHMLVEALFWFHPLVWWIGARLLDERERACDEAVLRAGADPQTYVDAILTVCTSYLEPPLPSMPGVTGSNLKHRVQAILGAHVAAGLSLAKKATLAVAAIVALAAPVAIGMLNSGPALAQPPSKQSPVIAQVAPQVRSKSPTTAPTEGRAPEWLDGLGNVTAYTVTVKPRVDGQLMSVNFKEGETVQAGQLLATIDPSLNEIQLAQAEGQLAVAQKDAPQFPPGRYEAELRIAQANVDRAKLTLSYTKVLAPVTGVAGLRQVDPGNIVHPMDAAGLVVITQLQPISVLFTIPEDYLPQIAARFWAGARPVVEAWNRDNSRILATGHLIAIDNQIDQNAGVVKLKAEFDNKDNALFPNQFVNVRVSLRAR